MEKENITPEERLLKIIESPQTVEKRKYSSGVIAKTKYKALSERIKKIDVKQLIKYFNFQLINRIAMAVCILITVYWLYDFLKIKMYFRDRISKINAEVKTPEDLKTFNLPEVGMKDVLFQAKKRNIFTFLAQEPKETREEMDNSAIISNLKLVGIIWSDNPQVMIEDSQAQKTYLLNSQESIGHAQVKKIFKDKVVLDIGGKEWELR